MNFIIFKYILKELSEHFIQKSEEEINHLRLENASLKSLLNSLQSTMHKNNEDENEQILQRQVRTLQVTYFASFFFL